MLVLSKFQCDCTVLFCTCAATVPGGLNVPFRARAVGQVVLPLPTKTSADAVRAGIEERSVVAQAGASAPEPAVEGSGAFSVGAATQGTPAAPAAVSTDVFAAEGKKAAALSIASATEAARVMLSPPPPQEDEATTESVGEEDGGTMSFFTESDVEEADVGEAAGALAAGVAAGAVGAAGVPVVEAAAAAAAVAAGAGAAAALKEGGGVSKEETVEVEEVSWLVGWLVRWLIGWCVG